MEIEEESIVKNTLKLIEQKQIGKSVENLLEIEKIDQNDFESFIESRILQLIFQHYIKEVEEMEKRLQKYSEDQINQFGNLLNIIERLTMICDKRLNVLIVKSNIKDLMSKLVTIKHITLNLQVFSVLSSLAKIIPEIFHRQFILVLQRSLLEKSSNPSQRLEYFLSIFHNLRENSSAYQIDAYFFINFLKMQFQQNMKLTRQSILIVIEILEHLIRYEENTENTTIKIAFEVVSEQMYPRLSVDYNICSSNCEESDSDIQFQFFNLINLFILYRYKQTSSFVAKNISELKNILFNVKRKRIPLINVNIILELINYSIQTQSEHSQIVIDHLLSWDSFQKILDDLTADSRRTSQNQSDVYMAKKIKQHICDMLINMLNKNQEHIFDYFINEYLVGQLVDLSTFLDSKRRQFGIEQVVNVLKYLKKQPQDKFIFDNDNSNQIVDESKETVDMDCQFASYKSNKIILNSLSDLFEVSQLPFDTNKVTPTYYVKMQQLSNKVKLKMYKQFGDKLPKSLMQYVDQYEQNSSTDMKKRQVGDINDEWEDITDENGDEKAHHQEMTINGFNILDYDFLDDDDDED